MASVFKRRDDGDWIIDYFDHTGRRRRRSSGTTDKRTADRIAAKLEADEALRRSGVVDAREDQLTREDLKSFATHVDDYVAHLKLHARAQRHVDAVKKCLLGLAAEVGIGRLSEVTRDNVETYLRALQANGIALRRPKGTDESDEAPKTRPMAARTLNYARNSIASFMAWAVGSRRARENSVAGIKRQSEAEPTRKRRALTSSELHALFETSDEVGRRPYYATAYFAGLRRSELKKLAWGDIDLDAGQLTVRDGKAKGRVDVLPIHDDLRAQLLRIRPETPHPASRVFPRVPTNKARKKDFERAGIASKLDDAGCVVDLHSLRATLGTDLARLGVAPQVAQRLLRHSTINLTMRHYTKLRIDDLAGGLGRLAVAQQPPAPRLAVAVGDGTPESSQQNRQQSSHETVRNGAEPCDVDDATNAPIGSDPDDGNSPSDPDLRDSSLVFFEPSEWWAMQDSNLRPPACKAEQSDRFPRENGDATSRGQQIRQQLAASDPVLAQVIEAWPTLPEAMRAAIAATVQAGQMAKR